MGCEESQPRLFEEGASHAPRVFRVRVMIDNARLCVRLEWSAHDPPHKPAASVTISNAAGEFQSMALDWKLTSEAGEQTFSSYANASSVRSRLNQLRERYPAPDTAITGAALSSGPTGESTVTEITNGQLLPEPWKEIVRVICAMGRLGGQLADERFRMAQARNRDPDRRFYALRITIDIQNERIQFDWRGASGGAAPSGSVFCTGSDELRWELTLPDGATEVLLSRHTKASVRATLANWLKRFPCDESDWSIFSIEPELGRSKPLCAEITPFEPGEDPRAWMEDAILTMAGAMGIKFYSGISPDASHFLEKLIRKAEEERRRKEELQARIRANQQRLQDLQRRKERERKVRAAAKKQEPSALPPAHAPIQSRPLPPVPVVVSLAGLAFQETLLPLSDLRGYFLLERAARWWVSNQSDDLLALPYCRIERLEYQVRTALRVIGVLRGRALLSDEVGLGKTIEAGLVLKEYLTRGMVKRFLILTVPSLVDQWEEELADKFNLSVATTNHAVFRAGPETFWREQNAIVASLHTLKQPAHLNIAQQATWDMLVVDEAHHLRNAASQSWQAVNALPRQFLLLLTATPVQNSLDELYNLVTLLQPGQLPSPKEFRARFIDKKRPHQPREPEELRRLLGQVMIRNTRANAGIKLPPRHAETVLFQPEPEETAFWEDWEKEFRQELAALNASQSMLWGRLLLQTAGSSPDAWLEALQSFPNRAAADRWTQRAPLVKSWEKKCDAVLPLCKGEGGVVIFTQFLKTQAALAGRLAAARAPVFVINGSVPAAERQPITERFRKQGGALLLTQSGAEGRNLQFCHRLVNFDLPWNPMEIEQRIGRLHRLGQQHPVRIYNLVQAGTLQEHLLQILQEKLNLFELVVGETGLILGDRFSSDEFAEEILRRWRESEGRVGDAMHAFGDELARARQSYDEIKKLDEMLFAKDYESI